MEDEEDMPPFWLQTTDRRHRLRSRASSFFLNSGVLLIVLLVLAFVFVFIIVPSFVSLISQIFRPQLIKKSWDYLNFVLVMFAIVCGFLNNNNGDKSNSGSRSYRSSSNGAQDLQRSYPSTPANRWYDQYQDRPAFSSLNRLRSFSSYPDLRQESLWLNNDERWKFYDDTHLNSYRVSRSSDQLQDHRPQQQQQQQQRQQEQEQEAVTEDVAVDSSIKEVVYTPPPPRSSPPPPQPLSPAAAPLSPQLPPPTSVRRKVKRTYQDLEHEKRREERDLEVENYIPATSIEQTPPPPPRSPPPVFSKSEKRRGKDFFTSLRRKRKRQRQKSAENLERLFDPQPSSSPFIPPPSPPPPPPPLPPPPNFFQNLFSSKKGKSKKENSVPPPPPPPVTSSSRTRVSKIVSQNVTPSLESRASRTTTVQVAEVTAHHAPKAVKTGGTSRRVEENVESGNSSPLIPIPPPPPPPPFKTSWKFVQDGDYVRVASFNSSRSGSPDLDSEDPSDKESSPMGRKDGDSTMPMFCPSPDVNTKAENFIATFRAGLNLEKVNSVKRRSNLGPGPDRVEGDDQS